MAVGIQTSAEELTFSEYTERQAHEVSAEGLILRAGRVKASDKFKNHHGVWEKIPYPGYAVLSMLRNNPGNENLLKQLQDLQAQLADRLAQPGKYYLLPSDSFHQTVANTLSSDRFEKYIRNAGIEERYPEMIREAFDQIALTNSSPEPIRMQLLGLSIFGSAIGILGTFQKASDFTRMIDFRNAFYANEALNAIDIRRTRPFIGHITLAYLDGTFDADDRNHLVDVCEELNKSLSNQDLVFNLSKTELRSYDDLSSFHTHPHYPEYSFINP